MVFIIRLSSVDVFYMENLFPKIAKETELQHANSFQPSACVSVSDVLLPKELHGQRMSELEQEAKTLYNLRISFQALYSFFFFLIYPMGHYVVFLLKILSDFGSPGWLSWLSI